MFDEHGYPTEEALQKLTRWPGDDSQGALEYARELWLWPSYASKRGRRYTFITGGWSGNEDVIAALESNYVVQGLCWQASYRGGKHVYELTSRAKSLKGYHKEDRSKTKAKRARGKS